MSGSRATFCPSCVPAGRTARGFSFVEILFAIAVLGIGFIMLAAIFPVGLQQTKLTLDETAAAGNARGAVAVVSQLSQVLTRYNFVTPADPINEVNSTYLLPHTCLQALPPAGTNVLAGDLDRGQSRTLPGQVRSLHDGRNFADAGIMTPTDIIDRRKYLWNRVNSELLNKANDRNAVALLYKRDIIATNNNGVVTARPAESAQVIVINSQVAAQSAYVANDANNATATIFNLEPRPVGVVIEFNTAVGAYTATFYSVKGSAAVVPANNSTDFSSNVIYDSTPNAVAEGAYIVISDDRITTAGSEGRMNGRIFKLGNYRTDLGTAVYELAPGHGYTLDPGVDGVKYNSSAPATKPGSYKDDITAIGRPTTGTLPIAGGGDGSGLTCAGPAVAYVLGKGFDNALYTPPGVSPNFSNYVGLAQDVAIYTTFVQAK